MQFASLRSTQKKRTSTRKRSKFYPTNSRRWAAVEWNHFLTFDSWTEEQRENVPDNLRLSVQHFKVSQQLKCILPGWESCRVCGEVSDQTGEVHWWPGRYDKHELARPHLVDCVFKGLVASQLLVQRMELLVKQKMNKRLQIWLLL